MMFSNIAKQLLRMMGQSGKIPGGIKAEHISLALERLKQALQAEPSVDEEDSDEEENPSVCLTVRAYPLIKMLTSSAEENANILWHEKSNMHKS